MFTPGTDLTQHAEPFKRLQCLGWCYFSGSPETYFLLHFSFARSFFPCKNFSSCALQYKILCCSQPMWNVWEAFSSELWVGFLCGSPFSNTAFLINNTDVIITTTPNLVITHWSLTPTREPPSIKPDILLPNIESCICLSHKQELVLEIIYTCSLYRCFSDCYINQNLVNWMELLKGHSKSNIVLQFSPASSPVYITPIYPFPYTPPPIYPLPI